MIKKSIYVMCFVFVSIFFWSCTPAVKKDDRKSLSVKKPASVIKKMKKKVVKKKPVKKKKPDDFALFLDKKKNVRVGLAEGKRKVGFKMDGAFTVFDLSGRKILRLGKSSFKWVVKAGADDKVVMENLKTGQKIILRNRIILTPEAEECSVVLYKMKQGKGWHWEKNKRGRYRGRIEFVKIGSSLTIVNELPIDYYLYGVVPSEMSASSPQEALKAQAILARTNVYSNIGRKYKGKPYSLFSDVYSQVYSGKGREDKRSNRAVDETSGKILTYKGRPVEAVFHASCGGFLETNSMVWSGKAKPYLPAHPDMPLHITGYRDLSSESVFRKWINSSPAAYCNMSKRKFPRGLNYAKKYFRWQKKFSRRDLEKVIKRKTGKNIGTLKNISILKRGKSGKARVVKVIGTKCNVNIVKELNIRKKLSQRPLYSANFYVEKRKVNRNGIAEEFVFHGAGFGHGAGMCQIGAVGMALDGYKYQDIVRFYFPGAKLGVLK